MDAGASCALDIADGGAHTHDDIGALLGISHERVRQIIVCASEKLAKRLPVVLQMTAADLARPWPSAPDSAPTDDDWFDGEFKAAVASAYERIVPPEERGRKMLQSPFAQLAARRRAASKPHDGGSR